MAADRIVARLAQIKALSSQLNAEADGEETPASLAEEAASLGLELAALYTAAQADEEEVG